MPSCWASARVVTAGGGGGGGRNGVGEQGPGSREGAAAWRGEDVCAVGARVSEVSSVTGVTMKRCPCRTARPSGPSTRRAPRATEARPPSWRTRPSLPSPDRPCLTLRDALVLIRLRMFERKTKTED